MTTNTLCLDINTEADTQELGERLAQGLRLGGIIYLEGDLGAGKTTLSRFLIQALGHSGSVKSPTYTLVEPYQIGELVVYHFDLYRLSDPEELEFMGIREYFADGVVCLIEWPERGGDRIPAADLVVTLNRVKDGNHQRRAQVKAIGKKGQNLLGGLTKI